MSEARALAAVLAGGAGKRMDGRKPAAQLGGRPLIDYAIAAACEAGLDVVVVAKPRSVLPPLQCETVFEPEEPRHPLCGAVAAIRHAGARPVVVVACDMPFLTGALLAWMAMLRTTAVVEVDGCLQPLLATFMPTALPTLEDALRSRISAHAAVSRLKPRRIDERVLARFGEPRRLCLNVNDATDLALAERALASLGSGDALGSREQLMRRQARAPGQPA